MYKTYVLWVGDIKDTLLMCTTFNKMIKKRHALANTVIQCDMFNGRKLTLAAYEPYTQKSGAS